MIKKHKTIPIFIPGLACPFQCIYCNQKMISGQQHIPSEHEIHSIVKTHLKTIDHEKHIIEIGFFGGNFTGLSTEVQEALLKVTNGYLQSGQVDAIRLSTRPDYINEENLKLLLHYGVETIELGAQSMDDEVLQKVGRGHSSQDIVAAAGMIKKLGFKLGLQMMIGLPGDTVEKSIMTARQIIELGAENTRIYPLLVIKQTPLEEMFLKGEYVPLKLEEAVEQVKALYSLFEENHVKIIRVGLHPSEGLINGENYIAGPFHASFRELVLSAIWREAFTPLMTNKKNRNITVFVSPDEINYAVGYESSNKKILKTHFYHVEFKPDNELNGRNYRVNYS